MGYEISAPTAYGGYTEPGLQASIIYSYSAVIGIRLIITLNAKYSHSPYAMHAQPSVAVVPHSRRLSGPCEFEVRFRPALRSNDFSSRL